MKQIIKKSMLVCFMMLVFIQTNLLPVKAEGENSTYKYVKNVKLKQYEDFEYQYCDICEGIVIVKYIGKGKKVVVPNKINDIEVKELGDFAFSCCETVREVILPDSIKIIGIDCFYHCTNLKKIAIPEGVTYLYSTFIGCENLTNVSLPESLSRIGWETFKDCKSLKKITIPDQVMEIGKQAFSGCDNLREIQLPKELKRIEKEAFKKCKKLKSIKIPDGTFCIEQRAFEGCSALNKVILPKDLYRIEAGTFKNCTSLKQLQIPSDVEKIETQAFYNCKKLKKIKFKGSNLDYVAQDAIKGIHKKAILDVPKKAVKKHRKIFHKSTGFKNTMTVA